MNRNYYCKVNSQEEANELLDKLVKLREPVTRTYALSNVWTYIGWKKDENNWEIIAQRHFVDSAIEVPASELIDYVTGKKLDKDALLEEAKRRYPVGTKFKSALRGDKYPLQTIVKGNIYLDKVEGRQVIWNGDGCGFIYDDENWAEIIEEPKVETKFEKGKWYKINNAWYAKHECIHGSGRYWRHGDRITVHGNFHNKPGNLGDNWKDVSIVLLTDLSEIQQYLPDGHPDKFTTSIAKEEVKSMKEWSDGYVVSLKHNAVCIKNFEIGDIAQVCGYNGIKLLSDNTEWSAGKINEINGQIKWFSTLQEAQKFSDELLGKSKTGLRVEDLVEGEIYVNGPDNGTMWCYIIKYSKNSSKKAVGLYKTGVYSAEYCNYMGDYTEGWLLRLATPDEKKWLNTCIKQDKFIPKEDLDKYDNEGNLMESMKYPEYVECISPGRGYTTHPNAKEYGCINYDYNTSLTKGRVYKVLEYIQINSGAWGFVLEFDGKHYLLGEAGAIKSTKEAYDAQFKKDEDYKVGDWVVVLDTPNIRKWDNGNRAIGYVFQIRGDKNYYEVFIKGKESAIDPINKYSINYKLTDVRKALPHEIPVENSVKQYPYTPEESIKLDFEVKWKESRYIGGVDSITATGCGIYEQMKKQPIQSRKTPELMDRTKIKVEIKRTKAKQIKL